MNNKYLKDKAAELTKDEPKVSLAVLSNQTSIITYYGRQLKPLLYSISIGNQHSLILTHLQFL
jgi:hypothetical protein